MEMHYLFGSASGSPKEYPIWQRWSLIYLRNFNTTLFTAMYCVLMGHVANPMVLVSSAQNKPDLIGCHLLNEAIIPILRLDFYQLVKTLHRSRNN